MDELPDLCEELKVSSMPTFQLYKKGEKIGELQGADREGLIKLLEKGLE